MSYGNEIEKKLLLTLQEDLNTEHAGFVTVDLDDNYLQNEVKSKTMINFGNAVAVTTKNIKNKSEYESDMNQLKKISSWNLPPTIEREYYIKGIIEMFDWQVNCLNKSKIFEYGNLIYSAPTAAGKTLVSELLMIKTIIERQKKALLILPFISVVREKMLYLQQKKT